MGSDRCLHRAIVVVRGVFKVDRSAPLGRLGRARLFKKGCAAQCTVQKNAAYQNSSLRKRRAKIKEITPRDVQHEGGRSSHIAVPTNIMHSTSPARPLLPTPLSLSPVPTLSFRRGGGSPTCSVTERRPPKAERPYRSETRRGHSGACSNRMSQTAGVMATVSPPRRAEENLRQL